MRRSATSDRASFAAPLRARNDGGSIGVPSSAVKQNARYPSSGRKSNNSVQRLSNAPNPTPRKSFLPVAASGGRNSRGSLAYGRPSLSRGDVKKDTRPLSDKSYQNKTIKKLVDFLVEQNYPYSINSKTLVSPMNKDFAHIFEFLYQFIEPQFVLPQKFEEEVLHILKNLGYPYTISKSAMYTVGSRHSWPTLLGALNWLREYIELLQMTNDNVEKIMFPTDNFDDDPMEFKLLFNFYEKYHMRYLKGEDCVDEEMKYLEEIAKEVALSELPCDPDDDIEQQCLQLEREIEMHENQPDPLTTLMEKQMTLKTDNDKYDEYIVNLNNHAARKKAEMEKLQLELNNMKSMIAEQEKCVDNKEKIVKAQNISQHDIERMKIEKEELHKGIMKHINESEEYEQRINQLQINAAQLTSQMETDCRKFNEIYMKTATVQQDYFHDNSSNTQTNQVNCDASVPADFHMKITFSQHQYLEWVNNVKPKLLKSKAIIGDRIEQLRDQLVDKEEVIFKLSDIENEQTEELEKLMNELEIADHRMGKSKDKFGLEQQRLQNDEDKFKNIVTELACNDHTDLELIDFEKKIDLAEQKLNQHIKTKGRQEAEITDFLNRSFLAVQKHFKQLKELKEHFENHCKNIVSNMKLKQIKEVSKEEIARKLAPSLQIQ